MLPPTFLVSPTTGWSWPCSSLPKGFGGVCPRYGFNRNPLTQFFNVSPASVPRWNVPLKVSIIQNGSIHRNWSFLGINPSHVWNTRTDVPTSNDFLVSRRCRSTKAFLCRHPCSSCVWLVNWSSPISSICSSLFYSDTDSDNHLVIWTHKLGTWNSIGMTASSPNASRNRVDWILILKLVWYAQRALYNFVSQSIWFALMFFFKILC